MINSDYMKLLLEQREKNCKSAKKEACKAKVEACKSKQEACNKKLEISRIKQDRDLKAKKTGMALSNIRKSLLSEAILTIYTESCDDKNVYNNDIEQIRRSIVDKFVEEQGCDKLITRFKTASSMLAEWAYLIENTTKKAAPKEREDDIVIHIDIDDELKEDFYNSLKSTDMDDTAAIIRHRVMAAMDDFITSNTNDKIDIESIVRQTTEKVDSSKKENIKEAYDRMGKSNIAKIRNRNTGCVLEFMIKNIASSSYNNDTMKDIFINESGSVDVDKVVSYAKTLYTFLETVNTTKMIPVDNKYISNIINSFK
ncbi:MAG: hypothetical protein ACRCXT_18195 [Paraclostridium sp.]